MFARLLGRNASNSVKEETPEQDDLQKNSIHENELENNNNQGGVLPQIVKKNIQPVLKVDDIEVEVVKSESMPRQIPPAGWVCSYEKNTIWLQDLADAMPKGLKTKLDRRITSSYQKNKDLNERMNSAWNRRVQLLREKSEKLGRRYNGVLHTVLLTQDQKWNQLRVREENMKKRLNKAEERRESVLAAKMVNKRGEESNDDVDYGAGNSISRQERMEAASKLRSLILEDKSRRAGQNAEYARLVATEVSHAEEEASAIVERLLEQRLERADVRRSIVLDRKRLAAGRHGNYVKSVYLTNRYMERRSAQMIQHNLDAANFRRDVLLEEIKSNARQQNLSAQFRACCAYRLLDAKWLNYALKSTAAQTTAKMRRDTKFDLQQQKLHEAEMKRADVRARYEMIISEKQDEQGLNERLHRAAYLRELQLYERRVIIQERNAIIRGRKAAANTINRRKKRQELENKVTAAAYRRSAFLERRRSVCATRNWHARVLADRQQEVYVEESANALQGLNAKLNAAEDRREEYVQPIFAQLVALRGIRAQHVIHANEKFNQRQLDRKIAFSKIRIASLNQARMNKSFERISRFKRVQSNRKFMDTFYKQVISNITMARQSGAKVRRELYNDAIRAAATETVERSQAARDRLEYLKQESLEILDFRLQNADARKNEALNERISTALWFQGKVTMANYREKERQARQTAISQEAIASASLRRSILLTRKQEPTCRRLRRYTQGQVELDNQTRVIKSAQQNKIYDANARREANLFRKMEVARNTSNRVTVARLEKKAEDVVDAAIRTAITKTMSQKADERRQEHLEDIQNHAANQVSYAKSVANYQKELQQVRAEVTLEQSKLRQLQTTKRRENLLEQRKLGHSTIDQLQPYAGLQIVGKSMPLVPNSA